MGNGLEEFFLNTKPVEMLVSLKKSSTDNYASAISCCVDSTYSHTVRVLQRMEAEDLVKFERKGRRKEVFLTEDGEELANAFCRVMETIDQ